MATIFVDSHFLIAIINKRDQWHDNASDFSSRITGSNFVTTDSILVETLNYFSEFRPDIKESAVKAVTGFVSRPEVTVIEQTSRLVNSGIRLYRARLDKGFSLTDCISMVVSRENGITSILTNDRNFLQEGFEILL